MLDTPGQHARTRLPQDARREQLIDATIRAIAENGLSNVTLNKVASRAGLTAGMVNFHFQSKQELLHATLARIASEYREACEAAVAAAGTSPAAGLMALVRASFDPHIASTEKLAVWYAFWGESRALDDYMSICGGSDQAFYESARELIEALASQVSGTVHARAAALGFCGIIDALSQEALVQRERFDRAEAIETCRRYLDNLFPGAFGQIEPLPAAQPAHPASAEEQDYLDRLTLPAWTYCDRDFSEREVARLHLPAWQLVCHISEMPEPGDYVTLNVLGRQAVAIRGEDGTIRAFHNVCRHRGHPVAQGRSGNTGGILRCPYHAWCYDNRGELKGIAASRTFPKLDRNTLGLFPVECEVFLGFVFVRFAPGGPSVAERYAPYLAELAPYRIEEMQPIAGYWEGVVEADWKNVWDNYLEDYHFPTGHPGLSALMGKDYDREPDYRTRTIRLSHRLRDTVEGSWATRMYSKVLPPCDHLPEAQRRRWTYFYLFPAVSLETYPDLVDVFHIVPLGPGRSLLRWRAYGLPGADRAMRAAQWLNQRINYAVHDEDNALIEAVQRNLAGGVYERGVLSDKEVNVKALHDWVREAMPEAR